MNSNRIQITKNIANTLIKVFELKSYDIRLIDSKSKNFYYLRMYVQCSEEEFNSSDFLQKVYNNEYPVKVISEVYNEYTDDSEFLTPSEKKYLCDSEFYSQSYGFSILELQSREVLFQPMDFEELKLKFNSQYNIEIQDEMYQDDNFVVIKLLLSQHPDTSVSSVEQVQDNQ